MTTAELTVYIRGVVALALWCMTGAALAAPANFRVVSYLSYNQHSKPASSPPNNRLPLSDSALQ
jgi:hypothetical protein